MEVGGRKALQFGYLRQITQPLLSRDPQKKYNIHELPRTVKVRLAGIIHQMVNT